MNETLKLLSKNILKDLLSQCTEPQQMMFKRMYSHTDLDKDIKKCVDDMDESKIDWAITQLERTVEKNNSQASK